MFGPGSEDFTLNYNILNYRGIILLFNFLPHTKYVLISFCTNFN